MTTAIYVRVSTEDQNPEGQRAELERWIAARPTAGPVLWFTDYESGKNLKRTHFKELEKLIAAGKCDTVIVWRLDRLARSYRDGVQLLARWIDRGVRLVSITEDIDLSGVVGQMIAAVLFALAEMELKASKQRQRVGIEAAKQRGVYPGRKPGVKKADEKKARRLREKGLTYAEIASALGVHKKTVQRYLSSEA